MILVTGASGNVGKAVVQQLVARQSPLRIGARKPDAAPAVAGGERVLFDFMDATTYAPAVAGCDALFLLRPPQLTDTKATLNRLIDVARAQGVAQVVFISVAGAGDNRLVPHHAVEQHLRAGPPNWTILRPGFFAQNLGDAYRTDIVEDNRIFIPAGQGRVAFVDVRDVGEVAVNAMLDPAPHHGKTYTLTGPQAVTLEEVVQMLSEILGRPIRYIPATVVNYLRHLTTRRNLPLAQAVVQTILHVGLRFGQAEAVDPTLEELLGHPSHTLRDYIEDHRDLWLLPTADA
jgi:uncharacterized protein YbjT (DUF2867 family)